MINVHITEIYDNWVNHFKINTPILLLNVHSSKLIQLLLYTMSISKSFTYMQCHYTSIKVVYILYIINNYIKQYRNILFYPQNLVKLNTEICFLKNNLFSK